MRVVIAAGGTAGHVFPALVLAEHLRERLAAEIQFVGGGGQEATLVPEAGFPLVTVDARPLTRRPSPRALAAIWTALRSARRCRPVIREVDVVVGMGGFASVPVVLAARTERIPLVIHEQNAVPGLANRLAARWASATALSFEDAAPRLPRRVRPVVTGLPIRPSIAGVSERRPHLAGEALVAFDLSAERRTVVVFGGSQGALHLNQAASEACALLSSRKDLQMLIITGPAHEHAVRARLPSGGELVWRVLPFAERMELAYAIADLVVARAGASTIAELAVSGAPSLLIPYPYATGGHQEANARVLARAGGAEVLLDGQLTPSILAARIRDLTDDPARLQTMGSAARTVGRPDAASALGKVVLRAAEKRS